MSDYDTSKRLREEPAIDNKLVISGDFDGDGSTEKMKEHYLSRIDNLEIDKPKNKVTNYDQLVESTAKKRPYSFVVSDNDRIDTLPISNDQQLFGLAYLKNEGDLNGDGTDEVSYVVDWADWSNLNTLILATYQNHHWTTLHEIPIWDWQLPANNPTDNPSKYDQGLVKK